MKNLFKTLFIVLCMITAAFFMSYSYADESSSSSDEEIFKNATYYFKQDGSSMSLFIETSGKVSAPAIYGYFTSTDSEPDTSTFNSNNLATLTYNTAKKVYETRDTAKALQQNQNIYFWIYSLKGSTYTLVGSSGKLTKPEVPNDYKLFSTATTLSSNSTQVFFNNYLGGLSVDESNKGMPNYLDSARKMTIKIGKVTDSKILSSIKNNESSGFSSLLSFAKDDSSPVYNEEKTCNDLRGYTESQALFDLKGKLTDNSNYYLYASLNDENGTYIPVEGVTLLYADLNSTSISFLYAYGQSDFQVNVENTGSDTPSDNNDSNGSSSGENNSSSGESSDENSSSSSDENSSSSSDSKSGSSAKSKIPQAGEKPIIIIAVLISILIAAIVYDKKQSNNYK